MKERDKEVHSTRIELTKLNEKFNKLSSAYSVKEEKKQQMKKYITFLEGKNESLKEKIETGASKKRFFKKGVCNVIEY